MTRPPGFFFFFSETKWKEKGVQTAKCIVEGEVWGQDCKMQTIVYLRSQNIEAWMVIGEATEYSLCKHCGCMLITSDYVSQVPQRKLTCRQTRNRKSTLCGLIGLLLGRYDSLIVHACNEDDVYVHNNYMFELLSANSVAIVPLAAIYCNT